MNHFNSLVLYQEYEFKTGKVANLSWKYGLILENRYQPPQLSTLTHKSCKTVIRNARYKVEHPIIGKPSSSRGQVSPAGLTPQVTPCGDCLCVCTVVFTTLFPTVVFTTPLPTRAETQDRPSTLQSWARDHSRAHLWLTSPPWCATAL